MSKEFLVTSRYVDPTPKGLKIGIDGCISYIVGTWLTTDFEIESVTVTDDKTGTKMVTVIATRPVVGKRAEAT